MKSIRSAGALFLALLLAAGLSGPHPAHAAPEPLPLPGERVTVGPDGTATLFAPFVSRTSGWYDANKNWHNDGRLCWAAACSNLIAWYLDACETTGWADVSGHERNVDRIFDRFRANWDPMEGNDPLHGMNWYFTGGFSSGGAPDGLVNDPSGGYLRDLPHCGDTWYVLDPARNLSVFGDYSAQFPIMDDAIGKYNPTDRLYDHAGFSRTILAQLTRGACAVTVGASAVSSHAITLWGCDFNPGTQLITKLYVTDSDDEDRLPGRALKELKIRARRPDANGVYIEGYYLNSSASPITEFLSSLAFFAPEGEALPQASRFSLEAVCGGPVCRGRVLYTGREPLAAQAVTAFYGGGGQLLTAAAQSVRLLPGRPLDLPLPAPEGAERFAVFLLDGFGVPLCEPASCGV